jgi:hypothetical protein
VSKEEHDLDLDYEDLLYMERSTFRTFIDDSQAAHLLLLWAHGEKADNDAFMRKFVWGSEDV